MTRHRLALIALAGLTCVAAPALAQTDAQANIPAPPDSQGDAWGSQPSARAQAQQNYDQGQQAYQQGQQTYQQQQQDYQAARSAYDNQSDVYAHQQDAYAHERNRFLHAREAYDAQYGAGAYARYWGAHVADYDSRFGPGAYERDFGAPN